MRWLACNSAFIGGTVVVETVFAWPGWACWSWTAFRPGLPGGAGVVLVIAVLVVIINLLVDVIYTVLDPRIGSAELDDQFTRSRRTS
jgi:peptide/nickel transport system permease protein